MFSFILALLLFFVAFVAVITFFVSKDPDSKAAAAATAVIGGILALLLLAFSAYQPIDAGKVGIKYGPSGSIVGQMNSGGFIAPWDHVKEVDTKIQNVEYDNLDVYSNDTIDAKMDISVNFHVDEKDAQPLIRTVGASYETTLIKSRAYNDAKDATAKYTAVRLTPNRENIRKYVAAKLEDELGKHGIQVDSVQVKNINLPASYLATIQARQSAIINAQAAQNKVAQIKAEAEQRVAKAKGTADANVVEAEGQARANRLIAESVSTDKGYIDYLNAQARVALAKNPATKIIPSNVFFSAPTP